MENSPLKPTQSLKRTNLDKVDEYAQLMKDGKWDWSKMDSPIYIDPNGKIVGGHHRILAAQKAGVEIPESAIRRLPRPTIRPTYDWNGNLLD